MACGLIINWISKKMFTCAFLVFTGASICFGGHRSMEQENMTIALYRCKEKDGLIGPDSYPVFLERMEANDLKDVWIDMHDFIQANGNWTFLDNTSLENAREYFEISTKPMGCGTMHIADTYFDNKNCFRSDYYALCQYGDCSQQTSNKTCLYKHSPERTKNWFHARDVCHNLEGSLAVLKSKDDIPQLTKLRDELSWIGVHSLNAKVVLQGKVPGVLANISLTDTDVSGLENGESCLVAEYATPVSWKVVPCSEKHPFICRKNLGNENQTAGKGHFLTPSLATTLLLIPQIGYLAIGQNQM